jgi:hypothetical protein
MPLGSRLGHAHEYPGRIDERLSPNLGWRRRLRLRVFEARSTDHGGARKFLQVNCAHGVFKRNLSPQTQSRPPKTTAPQFWRNPAIAH